MSSRSKQYDQHKPQLPPRRKTETPCRWCIYGLMRAGAGRVQCLLWGVAAKKGHTCDAARAVMMKEVSHGAE